MDAPRRLPDGRIEIPARAESEDGIIGDGILAIGPDDERYGVWDDYLRRADSSNRSK